MKSAKQCLYTFMYFLWKHIASYIDFNKVYSSAIEKFYCICYVHLYQVDQDVDNTWFTSWYALN